MALARCGTASSTGSSKRLGPRQASRSPARPRSATAPSQRQQGGAEPAAQASAGRRPTRPGYRADSCCQGASPSPAERCRRGRRRPGPGTGRWSAAAPLAAGGSAGQCAYRSAQRRSISTIQRRVRLGQCRPQRDRAAGSPGRSGSAVEPGPIAGARAARSSTVGSPQIGDVLLARLRLRRQQEVGHDHGTHPCARR